MSGNMLRRRQRGISLVEAMISLVIGLVVVGAVLVSIIGSSRAGKFQSAYAQMNEDAQIGLSILTRDIQVAGYSNPTSLTNLGTALNPNYQMNFANLGGQAIFGCDTDFANPVAANVACGVGATPAFEVVYEADVRNTVATALGLPSDCLGNTLAGPPYFARNRYFLAAGASGRPELYCAGVGNTSQPLIENVDAIRVWYGMQVAANPRQVVRYVSATDINGIGPAEWNNVISVRICLLVRSADPVLTADAEDTPRYLDCNSAPQVSNDRRLRRAYFTTAAIRARMPF